jgi:hypothetical protein
MISAENVFVKKMVKIKKINFFICGSPDFWFILSGT